MRPQIFFSIVGRVRQHTSAYKKEYLEGAFWRGWGQLEDCFSHSSSWDKSGYEQMHVP